MSEDPVEYATHYDAMAELYALLPGAESVAVIVLVDGAEHQFDAPWLAALLNNHSAVGRGTSNVPHVPVEEPQ